MRGHYSGSSETILDADLSTLFKKKSLDELIALLQQRVKKMTVDANDLARRSIRSPLFSMLYLVLKQNGAQDWWSGLKLSEKHLGKAHSIQYHHIFPNTNLRAQPPGSDK
jgi:hypothetical protein